MKKFVILSIILIGLLISTSALLVKGKEQPPMVEEQYYSVGFEQGKTAIKKFTREFKVNPLIGISNVLPFKESHCFGYFNSKMDDGNPILHVDYINDRNFALFKVMVFPINPGEKLKHNQTEKLSGMTDGTPFSFRKDKLFTFRFNTSKWGYVLVSNFKGENTSISTDDFIKIAQLIKANEKINSTLKRVLQKCFFYTKNNELFPPKITP